MPKRSANLAACLFTTAVAALAGAPAQATAYSAEYVFGDSLSDRGNLAEVYYRQNLPNPPSFQNSFSNGPVAVQLLAQRYGLTADPSLWVTAFQDPNHLYAPGYRPGTNYAVAGATSALGANGINLPNQIAAYAALTGQHADPNALYVLEIGGNDVRDAVLQHTGAPAVAAGVATEIAAVQALESEGAKNFLIVNVPNVGVIPEFAATDPVGAAAATLYSQQYDATLRAGLDALPSDPGATLHLFDLYAYNAYILQHPALFGLTNTTDPCYVATPGSAATSSACGPNAENIKDFAYWDAIHPTAKVQALWAGGMNAALTGVPESSTWAMMVMGFAGLGALRYRLSKRSPASV